MKIGILVTGHPPDELREKFGTYDGMFRTLLGGHGFTFETYHVVDSQFPENAESADGWVITGSRHGAYEDHPWIPPLEDLIRAIHDKGQPLIGVCFGHQIIAQALGGKVEKFKDLYGLDRKAAEAFFGSTTGFPQPPPEPKQRASRSVASSSSSNRGNSGGGFTNSLDFFNN